MMIIDAPYREAGRGLYDPNQERIERACPTCGGLSLMYKNLFEKHGAYDCDDCLKKKREEERAVRDAEGWQSYLADRIPDRYGRAEEQEVRASWLPLLPLQELNGGVGLIGPAGSGKSSAIACWLKRRKQGDQFLWWSGTEARDAAIDAATADKNRAEARKRWEEGMTTPLLIIDDISQGKMTEAWSSRLFDLLETRMSRCLPTAWTSQKAMKDFRAKIIAQNGGDTDQADAISRRLCQHSTILVHQQ